MSTIRFMSGPLRGLHLADGFYLVGEGVSVPVASPKEAERIIAKVIASRPRRGRPPIGDWSMTSTETAAKPRDTGDRGIARLKAHSLYLLIWTWSSMASFPSRLCGWNRGRRR